MATDRGGLQYTIEIHDLFTTSLKDFRAELQKSREAFAEFRKATAREAKAGRGLKEQAKAAKEVTNATRATTKATRELTTAETDEERVLRKLARRMRNAADERRIQTIAMRDSLVITRQAARAASIEEQATIKLARAKEKLAVDERAAALAGADAVKLHLAKAAALTQEEKIDRKIAAARERLAVSEGAANKAGADAVRLGLKRADALTVEEKAARRVARARDLLREKELAANIAGAEAVALGLRKAKALTIEEEASKRIERALRRQAVARAQIAKLQAAGLTIPSSVRREAQGFDQDLERIGTRGNSLLFTFRRLFGVLALFQGVRILFRGFIDAIKSAVLFNATIQQSELALAALFSAVGDVRDALGQSVTPARELELATQEARRQIRLLRQDAINTQATFEELLETFQTAVAPGLVAGLTIDQIREFSVRISQAASALGIAQNQLSEEIRSILSGTIQARTTRIATALGITNEDIRRAKQMGVLFEFLTGEFEAFGAAGDKALETFGGLVGRIRDSVQAVLGLAGAGLFENTLDTLRQIFDLLTVENAETGLLQPDPRAAAILREIFDPLSDALTTARDLTRSLSFQEVQIAARAFGQTLRTVLEVAVGLVQGLVEGVSIVTSVFQGFADATGLTVRETARGVARLVALFVTLVIPIRLVGGLIVDLFVGFKKLKPLIEATKLKLERWAPALTASVVPLLQIGAIVGGILLAFDQVVGMIFGINTTLRETVQLFGLGLAGAIQSTITFFEKLSSNIVATTQRIFNQLIEGGERAIRQARIFVNEAIGNDAEAQRLKDAQFLSDKTQEKKLADIKKTNAEELADIEERAKNIQLEIEKEIASVVANAAAREARGPGFDPNAVKELGVDSANAADQARSLLEIFQGIPPVISSTGEQISKLDASLVDAQKTARELGIEFQQAIVSGGITGIVGQVQQLFDQATREAKEQTFELGQQNIQIEEKLAELREAEFQAVTKANALQVEKRDAIFDALEARREEVAIDQQIANIDKEIRLTQLEIARARAEGRDADAAVVSINELRDAKLRLDAEKDLIEKKLAGTKLDKETGDLLEQIASLQTNIASAERDLNDLLAVQAQLERQLLDTAIQKAAIIAAERVPQLARENALLQAQAAAERAITLVEEQGLTAAARAVVEATNEVDLARVQLALRLETLRVERNRLAALAQNASIGSKEKEQLELLVSGLDRQLALEEEIGDSLARQLEERKRLAALVESGSINQGFREGFKQFAQEFNTEFQVGLDLAKQSVQSFASFASSAIVNAFDPTNETSLGEQTGRFLQGLAQTWLDQLIQLQIANQLQSAFGIGAAGADITTQAAEQTTIAARQAVVTQEALAFTTFATAVAAFAPSMVPFAGGATTFSTGAGILAAAIPALQAAATTLLTAAQIQAGVAVAGGGVAEGGQPRPGWMPSPAHFSSAARGYGSGDLVRDPHAHFDRPAGLDPRDTIPAWLRPGEFVLTPEAVGNLGLPFVRWLHEFAQHGFNTSRIQRATRRATKAQGFAEGGLVSDNLVEAARASGSKGTSSGGGGRADVSRAVVVPDNEAFSRMLAAGEPAMLSFLRKHRDTIGGNGSRGTR